MTTKEKILVYSMVIIMFSLIGFGVGLLVGTRETVNNLNDVDKVHFGMAQKDYKYCPYCGEYLESEK